MKKIKIAILLLVSIFVGIFVYNDDFLYPNPILRIEKITVEREDISQNALGLKETYRTLKIQGVITNGTKKGEKKEIEYEETYSSIVTDKYRVGDKVILDENDINLKRDFYLVILILVFINSIYIVGSYKGLLSIGSVLLNGIVFYIGLFLYFKGINLILLTILEMIIFAVLSLILASGWNQKTIAAIISVIVSIFGMLLLLLLVVKVSNYKGINFNELSFLTVPPEDIIIPELLIGTIGAIMDVAITISSAISELIEKNKKISKKNLQKSSKEIGKDIMSTMSNVLFFTYLCAGLPIFVLALRNGFSMYNYISTNLSLELSRFLIGSIGIVMTIPITTNVSIYWMQRGGKQ